MIDTIDRNRCKFVVRYDTDIETNKLYYGSFSNICEFIKRPRVIVCYFCSTKIDGTWYYRIAWNEFMSLMKNETATVTLMDE